MQLFATWVTFQVVYIWIQDRGKPLQYLLWCLYSIRRMVFRRLFGSINASSLQVGWWSSVSLQRCLIGFKSGLQLGHWWTLPAAPYPPLHCLDCVYIPWNLSLHICPRSWNTQHDAAMTVLHWRAAINRVFNAQLNAILVFFNTSVCNNN